MSPDLDLDVDRERVRRWAKRLGYGTLLVVAVVGLFAAFIATVMFAGVVAAVLYWFLFWCGLLWIPATIFMFGPMFPKSMRGAFGLGHAFLMQFAHGGTALVQDDDEYHHAVLDADEGRYYYDGEWHDVTDPENNISILAWQPFTVLHHKRDDAYASARPDDVDAAADGGTQQRGGYTVQREAGVDDPDVWTLDISQYVTDGIRALGDVDILEKTEEITERKQTDDSRLGGWEPLVATLTGIVLGLGTGAVSMGLV